MTLEEGEFKMLIDGCINPHILDCILEYVPYSIRHMHTNFVESSLHVCQIIDDLHK